MKRIQKTLRLVATIVDHTVCLLWRLNLKRSAVENSMVTTSPAVQSNYIYDTQIGDSKAYSGGLSIPSLLILGRWSIVT